LAWAKHICRHLMAGGVLLCVGCITRCILFLSSRSHTDAYQGPFKCSMSTVFNAIQYGIVIKRCLNEPLRNNVGLCRCLFIAQSNVRSWRVLTLASISSHHNFPDSWWTWTHSQKSFLLRNPLILFIGFKWVGV
jgi:hypothetical protein